MKNFSLYKKTWLIIATSIILTVSILGSVVSLFAKDFIYDVQQTRFETLVDEIKEAFATESSETVLMKYESYDLVMILGQKGEILLPTDFLEASEEEIKLVDAEGPITSIIHGSQAKDFFVTFREVVIDGVESSMVVRYPVILGTNEMRDILIRILPYFLIITLVVTSIIAMIYARYFSGRIKHVNDVVDDMAKGRHKLNTIPLQGDEIAGLENEINTMYQTLQDTLHHLNEKVETVTRLEADRKLFMRGTIHELKTPIMNMSLEVEQQLSADKVVNEAFLLRMNRRLSSMSKLIKELLEMSSHEEITDLGTVNLNEAFVETMSFYDYLLEDNQNRVVYTTNEPLDIKIPHRSLQKILSNLLGNAIKYSVPKSDLVVTIDAEGFTIQNHFNNQGQLMDAKIEEPFVTISNSDDLDSNGLGLYLVKSLLLYYGLQGTWSVDENVFTYRFASYSSNDPKTLPASE